MWVITRRDQDGRPAKPVGLVRARLLAALDADRTSRLGLVVAPAGSGKTTLLTQYASTFDGPVWWHATETGDASSSAFLRRLGATLGVGDDATGADDLVRRLSAAPHPRGLLVVDDLHRVDRTGAETVLADLLTRLPSWLHVLVGSRTMPTFNYSQHELSDITVVDGDQLRFRAWEVECLLRDVYGQPLPPDDVATLSRRVGGWAAGLHMFHLSTQGRPLAERRHALAALDGRSRRTRDYLAGTVLAELPGATREFLIRTCVFDVLTADRCARLLRRDDAAAAQAMFEELERRQAFTVSYDGGVTFRYHEVLRAHLAALLVESLGEPGARAWHADAARLLESDGHLSEAVRAYARAEDWTAVRRLLGRVGRDVAAEDFAHWRDTLPGWLVAGDPWLIMADGRHWFSRGHLARATHEFRRAEALFADEPGRERCRVARQQAAVWLPAGVGQAAPPGDADDPMVRLRAATRRHPGAVAMVPGAPGHPATLLASAVGLLLAGDVRASRRILDRAADYPGDETPALAARLLHAAYRLVEGDAGAVDRLDRLALDAEHAQVPWLVRMARCAPALGGTATAVKDAYAVAEECDRDHDAWGAVLATGAAVLGGLFTGDVDAAAAADLVRRCRELDADALLSWARAIAAYADLLAGAPDAGLLAGEAAQFARACGVPGAGAFALAVAARHGQAPAVRSAAVAAADECGLPAGLATLLLGPAAGPAQADAMEEPPVSVRCFGGFALEIAGRAVDLSGIKPRTRMALRLLAMHAGRPVHREVLAAALWPEMDQATATRNLHVALSSLRTFLEPGTPRGHSALIARNGDAYELALPSGRDSDVAAFTASLAAARRAEAIGDHRTAVASLREALLAYSGDLLPEDGPAEWVVPTRETLRQQAADAAERLAEACLDDGDAAGARDAAHLCLRIDTYRDRGWRLLMEAHRQLGNIAAADRAARDYAALLASLGLDADPPAAPEPAAAPRPRPAPSTAPRPTAPSQVSAGRRTPPPRSPLDGRSAGRTPSGSSVVSSLPQVPTPRRSAVQPGPSR